MSIREKLTSANPWTGLAIGDPPYCAAADMAVVAAHNRRLPEDDDRRIHLDVYPEPYIGDLEAPILLLWANPGYDETSPIAHSSPDIGKLCRDNLLHQPAARPFYPLSQTYLDNGGSDYFSRSLGYWIQTYGPAIVSRAVLTVESLPYASRRHPRLRDSVPSQQYSVEIARQKIRSGCTTIVVRRYEEWSKMLPELESSRHYKTLNSQSSSLAPAHGRASGNLPIGAEADIRKAIRQLVAEAR